MNAIVVVDQNWAIGRDNDLLFSLPTDMKRFRSLTLGGTVILGRRTLDSFPGGRPLPKRRNIVITHCPDFSREGAETVSSLAAMREDLPTEAGRRVRRSPQSWGEDSGAARRGAPPEEKKRPAGISRRAAAQSHSFVFT